LDEKLTNLLEPWEVKFESLGQKQKMVLISSLVGVISLVFFSIFSPIVAILGLIILYEAFAILKLNLKIRVYSKKRPDPILESLKEYSESTQSMTNPSERPSIQSLESRQGEKKDHYGNRMYLSTYSPGKKYL